jgi:chromosome segregation ATPase
VDCIRAQHRQQTEENKWLQTRLEQVESEGREEADRIRAQYQQQTDENERLEARLEQARAQYREQIDENERLEVRLEQAREEVARMRAQYQQKTDENERLEARLEQAREEVDRVGAHYQQQIDELNSALQSNAESSEQEKASLRNDIQLLSRKLAVKDVGLLGPGGASIDRLIARPFFDHLDKWAVT